MQETDYVGQKRQKYLYSQKGKRRYFNHETKTVCYKKEHSENKNKLLKIQV